MNKRVIGRTELNQKLRDVEEAKEALVNAQCCYADCEWSLKEAILHDPNLANNVMTVSYAKLRRLLRHMEE